jgi:putative ABC transport system ATP-binding protein
MNSSIKMKKRTLLPGASACLMRKQSIRTRFASDPAERAVLRTFNSIPTITTTMATTIESPTVEVDRVTKRYGSGPGALVALHEVSLSVARGRLVALLGASGSGKSTLLNLLGAVDRPTTGSIRIAGTDLASLSEPQLALFRRRRLGFVFQSFHLLPSLTVFDNVAVPFVLDRQLDDRRRREIDALLDRLGVADKAHRYPDELSGGQQQRVALARAVVHRPELILADEPTGNLDAHSGRVTLDLLVDLQRDFSLTIIIATHSDEAAARCDERIRLADGQIVVAAAGAAVEVAAEEAVRP